MVILATITTDTYSQITEEEAADPAKAAEKDLEKTRKLMAKARQALESEPDNCEKERKTCMLYRLEEGADDRILSEGYVSRVGEQEHYYLPETRNMKEYYKYTNSEFMKTFKVWAKTESKERALLEATDYIYKMLESSFMAAKKMDKLSIGGTSGLSDTQKAYYLWITKRQKSPFSVYSAMVKNPCEGKFSNEGCQE
jgi:hypothetical protein